MHAPLVKRQLAVHMNKILLILGLAIVLVVLSPPANPRANDIQNELAQAACLALNAYHEARGEPLMGQLLTIFVVLNRVDHPDYPATPCDVIFQGPMVESWRGDGTTFPARNRCQFSWWCDGKSDAIHNDIAYAKLFVLSRAVLAGKVSDFSNGATHYHATSVSPKWGFIRLTQVGDHIFYRQEIG